LQKPKANQSLGYLWQTGYANRAFSTPLFEDVPPFLKSVYSHHSKTLAIFSSGSVFAQKLLFQYVADSVFISGSTIKPDEGSGVSDLNYLFGNRYYDTVNAGNKTQKESYEKIAKEMGREPEEVLFLSDNVNEVRAALAAGMDAAVVDRPGNAPLSDADQHEFLVIESFDEIKRIAELERTEV